MATTTRPATDGQATTIQKTDSDLELFRGTLIPGIYFDSGYCIWAFDFTTAPDGIEPFRDVWIDSPEGKRTLYISSETALETIDGNHPFDETSLATIAIEQTTADSTRVTLEGDDGVTLNFELSFNQTTGTRLLNAVAALTPKRIARSRFGAAVSTLALNQLVTANGAKVAGRFATGEPYRFEASRVATVTDAKATLNGSDLGQPTQPSVPLADGDVKNMPLYIHADVYVPVHEHGMDARQSE